jgi:hypothetical protein
MKRTMILFFVFVLSIAAGAQQRGPVQRAPQPGSGVAPLHPDNSKPEPSAVYGYVTVVDPNSGRHYVGCQTCSLSERGSGLSFNITVVFRGTMDASQTSSVIGASGGVYYGNPPQAVWYCIPFVQDSAVGAYPLFSRTEFKVRYDPAKWRFLRIDVDPVGWQEPQSDSIDATITDVRVPVHRAATFADLPDFHGSIYGPSAVPAPARH